MRDKEGFLRSERSFIQTIGRLPNINGQVIMYARGDPSMAAALREWSAARNSSLIMRDTPRTVQKGIARPAGNSGGGGAASISGLSENARAMGKRNGHVIRIRRNEGAAGIEL